MKDVRTFRLLALLAALAVPASLQACASADATPDGGGNNNGGADADPLAPDADPLAPDADPLAPDANPATSADANNCPIQPCGLVDQCGCGAGQACDLDGDMLATGGTECRDVFAEGGDTSTCANVDECSAGYVCLGGSNGQCRRYCAADTDCPGDGSLCVIQITYGGGMEVPGAKTCTKDCDPLAQSNPTGCPTGWTGGAACHIFVDDPDGSLGTTTGANGDERTLTDCTVAGAGTDGVTCTSSSDCAAGFDCINSGGTTACRQNCLRSSPTCGVGTCRALTPAATVGGVEYGVCIP